MKRVNTYLLNGVLWAALMIAGPFVHNASAKDEAIGPQDAPPSIDGFMDFTKFCDFRDNAPISDKCYGFVGAVVEMKRLSDVNAILQGEVYYGACIPRRITVDEIFRRIRRRLRETVGICVGQCNSADYIVGALDKTYPCKDKHHP